jgi:hypothetical protein
MVVEVTAHMADHVLYNNDNDCVSDWECGRDTGCASLRSLSMICISICISICIYIDIYIHEYTSRAVVGSEDGTYL